MPPRGRSHGGGGTDEPDATPSRPRGARANVSHVSGGEEAVAEVSRAGRSTADGGTGGNSRETTGATSRPPSDDLLTQGTGEPGGTPAGHPTTIPRKSDDETRRSLEMENSGAVTIADAGYRIQQNPSPAEVAGSRQVTGDTGDPQKNPDYLIEGRVFDCYSPTNPNKGVRGIWYEVQDKIIERRQAQRAVVNLEDWTGDLPALQKQFRDWPIPDLKEVKAILPSGEIVQIDLPPTTD